MPLPRPVLLLLAAGASSRMRGGDKLLEDAGGEPMLARAARAAAATGLEVIVTLRPDRPLRARALDGLGVRRVIVPDAGDGMAASLRAGVAASPPGAPVAVLLADMPEIESGDLLRLVEAFEAAGGARVVRAAAEDGRPGQPVIFPARLREALLALSGDTGGRDILRREDALLVPLPGTRALTDLDTPEDFDAWRRDRG
ncbi:MAG: nucleotidyltransferase family protein [Rhodobacteraceae bacterium]|nr:nucleotidyltransferase family protein [Paracoccaceae bacterium]